MKFFLHTLLTLCLVLVAANCEQLSTVFVLETSDSSGGSNSNSNSNSNNNNDLGSSSSSRESKVINEPSTRIITDNSDPPQPISSSQNNPPISQNNQHYNSPQAQQTNHHLTTASHYQQDHLKPITRSTSQQQTQQHQVSSSQASHHEQAPSQQQQQSHPKSRVSSTTSTTESYEKSPPPNTEERLLISISSDDDSDYNKPPKKNNNNNNGYDSHQDSENPVSTSQIPKRKPQITISIQDANLKQDGSSGGAVILRPSENGIVISTVGGSLISSNNPAIHHQQAGKPHVNKPQISVLQPGNSHDGTIEIPVQHVNHPATSTHRPIISSSGGNHGSQDYLPSVNRPITSTLVDPVRPLPSHLSDERPQRPVANDYDREPSRPITQRPQSIVTRPPPQFETNSNLNHHNQNNNNNNINNHNNNNNNNNDLDISTNPSGNFQQANNGLGNGQLGEPKYPLNEKNCGLLHDTRIVGGDEANPDDYLWMAAIIKSKPTNDGQAMPFCGGSLITRRHILTAAHCLENLAPRDVLVRLGSYDFDDATASSLSADYAIDQFRVPGHYSKKTHSADIAIMRLKTPLSISENYKTVCMPQARRSYVGALGTVTGYGSQSQTFRKAAPKLRQVTVPIWENRKCGVVYKKNMTDSYLCAGYEEGGKDACQGDSGGPLMTEGPNERMMVVGVVSHGIGCGSPGYPGVYTRTTTFLDWIEKNTRE